MDTENPVWPQRKVASEDLFRVSRCSAWTVRRRTSRSASKAGHAVTRGYSTTIGVGVGTANNGSVERTGESLGWLWALVFASVAGDGADSTDSTSVAPPRPLDSLRHEVSSPAASRPAHAAERRIIARCQRSSTSTTIPGLNGTGRRRCRSRRSGRRPARPGGPSWRTRCPCPASRRRSGCG